MSESHVLARARGGAEHPLSAKPINDFRDDRGIVKARKNINALTPEELARFRNAVAQMKSLDNHFQNMRAQYPSALGNPRQAARFLCGLSSPALTKTKLSQHQLFGALAERHFGEVLDWCSRVS